MSTSSTSLRNRLSANLRSGGLAVALVAIIALFAVLTGGQSLSPQNVSNIITQNAYILVMAIGMLFAILMADIDLSVGSVVALTGAVAGVVTVSWGLPWPVGVAAGLTVGILVGVWHGFWIAFVGIPAFIVTLAGMLIFRGLTMIVLNNLQISPFPDGFRSIASGFLNGLLGGYGYDLFTLVLAAALLALFVLRDLRARRRSIANEVAVVPMGVWVVKIVGVCGAGMAFAWLLATYKGTPFVLLILGVLIVLYSFISNRTVWGRQVYAIGGNREAAALSGVKVKWVRFLVFVNCSFLASIAGIIFTSRLNVAGPKAGNGFELDAIAACFIGGAAVTGGIGTVVGAMIGGLVMAVMNNGMSLMGVGIDYQQAIKGLVVLGAVAFDLVNKKRAGSAA
ncbi:MULTISPECIES: multiple monosaccharide ABC transporter permease [unclassified Actinomyces]|uniref:multiple monosaccharide ABC transporter permease n=1 Tax=unclassified Actinomyces TaxID=2609248 RepID=UPI0020183D8E|nr:MULTISPECIES: multiple monosaccharide ABC transporter permease [unclassified Actinomyces]MCL3777117.1 sugar ABC transporter permease [Actinomyces sp. AC-20-1]MCL3788967.1 sugar ABC transporter permease [Actinomyces sp. 187325]MCL3791303.1 sugar ABC transporter permease [Actinomyces sp. 186855]MCL3794134.1 sugar ABC transporter permease [Actinomyces sp. 217892]